MRGPTTIPTISMRSSGPILPDCFFDVSRLSSRPMSKITDCDTAPCGAGSVEQRLARLLEAPFLARVVPHLLPETLHRLVRHCGLEACGAILTSATPAQLVSLLDLDLWRPAQPG